MNRRWVTTLGLVCLGTAALAAQGCSESKGGSKPEDPQVGTLSLPLATESASGTRYRLRDATFEIYGEYYGYGSSGEGGASGGPLIVSSEDDPDATAISLSLEQGYYYIRLLPGWRMEKIVAGTVIGVDANLLNGEYQSIWVAPQWTTWVEYEFGIGDRSIWLNGNVNIGVRVYEDPSERYPSYGGSVATGGSGWAGTGGSSWAGAFPGSGGLAGADGEL